MTKPSLPDPESVDEIEKRRKEAAKRALAEAEARRAQAESEAKAAENARPKEYSGPKGPEPTRYGDWERKGIASDF